MNRAHRKRTVPEPIARNGSAEPDHAGAMAVAARTAGNLRRLYQRRTLNVEPQAVIAVLNQAGIRFTLMGAHAIAGWLDEPRATQDVDVLVHRHHRKATRAIKDAFPKLTVQELPAVTRFIDPTNNLPVIDLMKPQARLHKAVARHEHTVGKTYRIPDLEMALALKWAAMTAPNRPLRKQRLDEADFIGMVQHNREIVDQSKLAVLGELVKRGGGREIIAMVKDANEDRPLRRPRERE